MKAIVLDGELRLDERRREPEPGPGEAVVRVVRAGVCGTDLEMVRGYKGGFVGVLGHEFVGVVERADGGAGLVGRRVAGEINVVCGTCATCRAGRRTHCERRTVIGVIGRDGAFAERVCVPVGNLHVLPDSVSDDAAVFIEPLASAARIAQQVECGAGTRVIVVGDGRLGLLVAQTLALGGAAVTLLGHHTANLAIAAARGIATAMQAGDVTPGADVVVDAAGTPRGLAATMELVRPQGTVVLKTTCAGGVVHAVDWNRVVVDELSIVGSRCGPFDVAIRMLAAGSVDVASLVAARYPLDRGVEAFDHASCPGVLKVLLEP